MEEYVTKDKDNNNEKGEVSRRDFLVGAGAVVVGGTISAGLLSGCGGGETVTTTKTVSVPTTVTTTVGGATTVTKTVPTTVTTTVGGVQPWQEPEVTHYMQLTFH